MLLTDFGPDEIQLSLEVGEQKLEPCDTILGPSWTFIQGSWVGLVK